VNDRLPLPFKSDSGESSSYADHIESLSAPPVSGAESTSAAFESSYADTAMGLLARYNAQSDFEKSGKVISAEEANKRHPNMPTPFRLPVNPNVAQMLADRNDEQQTRDRVIQAGPQDLGQAAKNFGAGLLAHAMDPVEQGAGIGIGMGVGAVLAKTAMGARALAAGGSKVSPRVMLNALESVSGNIIQNSAQEVGIGAIANREQAEYDPVQGAKQAVISTFFGSLLHMGGKEIGFQGKSAFLKYLNNTSPDLAAPIIKGVTGQLANGVTPNAEPIMNAGATETDVKGNYTYQPLAEGSPGTKKFYVPTHQGSLLNIDTQRPVGEIVASGLKMTDNPEVAGAAANRSTAPSPGMVWEVEAKDLKAVNINTTMSDEVRPVFEQLAEGVMTKKEFEKATPRDVLNAVMDSIDAGEATPDKLIKLQEDLKAMGYNAFQNDGTNVEGFEHSPHNDITVFGDKLLKKTNSWSADGAEIKTPGPEVAQKITEYNADPANRMDVDRGSVEAQKAKDEYDAQLGKGKKDDLKYIQDNIDNTREMLEGVKKQGILDEEGQAMLDGLDQIEADAEAEHKLVKATIHCVLLNG
jgi:hypothetical protein